MKKILILAALLAAVSIAAQENPVLKMYPDNITFYSSFNQGTVTADQAKGAPEAEITSKKPLEFEEKGFLGKALKSGRIYYKAAQNVDLAVPGTIILWVTPAWEQTKPENGKEPGFTLAYLIGRSEAYTYELIIGKMNGQPWKNALMNTYVQYSPNANHPHVNCIVNGKNIAAENWGKGTWYMLAATWGDGKFTNSVNGQKSTVSKLKDPTVGTMQKLEFNCEGSVILDEVVVLNKALTDAELAKIYTDTMAVVSPNAK